MGFEEWKQTETGRQAAERADRLTKEQKIAEIMRILMTLAGEPADAIADQMRQCLHENS